MNSQEMGADGERLKMMLSSVETRHGKEGVRTMGAMLQLDNTLYSAMSMASLARDLSKSAEERVAFDVTLQALGTAMQTSVISLMTICLQGMPEDKMLDFVRCYNSMAKVVNTISLTTQATNG